MKNKYIVLGLFITSLFMVSCEDTLINTVEETVETQVENQLSEGHAIVEVRDLEEVFQSYGSLSLENTYEEFPNGSSVSSWFGIQMILGENYVLDFEEEEFNFSDGGKLSYWVSMSDSSSPIDTELRLELDTPYPADIIYYGDVTSMEELIAIEDTEGYPGLGEQSIMITITEINDDSFIGFLEGTYIEFPSNEIVEISVEFDVERVL